MLPDYKNVLRAPFREWAKTPCRVSMTRATVFLGVTKLFSSPFTTFGGIPHVGNQKYVIELQEDGLPHLPIFDLDHVAPNDARLMLKTYIEFTWSEYLMLR
jgi:hypothetical protein